MMGTHERNDGVADITECSYTIYTRGFDLEKQQHCTSLRIRMKGYDAPRNDDGNGGDDEGRLLLSAATGGDVSRR